MDLQVSQQIEIRKTHDMFLRGTSTEDTKSLLPPHRSSKARHVHRHVNAPHVRPPHTNDGDEEGASGRGAEVTGRLMSELMSSWEISLLWKYFPFTSVA